MCHVHLIVEGPLSREQRLKKCCIIRKNHRSAVIQFFDIKSKKFEKNHERYLKKHPNSLLHKNY